MPLFPPFLQNPFQEAPKLTYTKTEAMIPMRDGVRLYTAIYAPKQTNQKWPILMERTPYGAGPYGIKRIGRLGPSMEFQRAGYIFVVQDVRGRWMSEGKHLYSSPPKLNKRGVEHDESTDAYDSIDWLLKNVQNNNGKVGLWGISQPGFYAGNALLGAHPAVRAVSPQAPVTDRFKGDDDHHNGAFFLAQRVSLLSSFGAPRPIPTDHGLPGFRMPYPDAYRYFLDLGPLSHYQKIFRWNNQFWNSENEHPNYDSFWKVRGMEQYYRGIAGPAVLTVGGWYDAEDMWGALHTYKALEHGSPGLTNTLVMGPWSHGQWASDDGERLGPIEFENKTGKLFREEIQFPFFEHYLRDAKDPGLPEAYVFESGGNKWHKFDVWPPKEAKPLTFYLRPKGAVSTEAPTHSETSAFDAYTSDPRRPVPHTGDAAGGVSRPFMVENQRFAWVRPDVLSYQTEPLKEDLTLAGPIHATLNVKNTGTDADYVVKVIDVYPEDEPANTLVTPTVRMAGYQMLVRWEVMRGRFRNSLEHPEPMVPGHLTRVPIELNDLFHTWKKGHRLMVQIQSSMFPLIDRNPQKFVPNIFAATDADFQPAVQSLAVAGPDTCKLEVFRLPSSQPGGGKSH
ncbi:CocE/NonD family hydrolase [Fimbriimonas ginsengisoli]|nr:CocE/NonD family hydrolase [Fimbriimonas ginsengisoli]